MTHDDEDDELDWSAQVAATVAAEVRRRRKERHMSAERLSQVCSEIGYPIPRNVIANMESGRRTSLPLVDVIVLAKALETNPISLIIPVGHISTYAELPLRGAGSPWDALTWFTGEDDKFDTDWSLRLHRFHHAVLTSAEEARRYAKSRRQQASMANDPDKRSIALRSAEHHEQSLADDYAALRRVRAQMRSAGFRPPTLPRYFVFLDEHPHGPDPNSPEEDA
ncbi:hypothetical protein AN219_10630 [Streptomyces nanshensis]|nr:hypothetical protein AN219_10630 [Streptomyces nanshensis]